MDTHLSKVAVWERSDGGVSITYFDRRDMERYGFVDEDQFIAWYIQRISGNHLGATPSIIDKKDVEEDSENRDCWSLVEGKVKVDVSKVQEKESAILQKEANRQAILDKLGITKEEANELVNIIKR